MDEVKECLNEEDEILVIGNEPYYYIYLDKQPKFKYFFQVPIALYKKDVITETVKYVEEKKTKIIINNLKDRDREMYKIYNEEFLRILDQDYQEFKNDIFTYYKLKENIQK